MALKQPQSMDECIYFTRRTIEPKGRLMAWVMKEKCPKCKKGMMAKPRDPKTGRPMIRAKEYVCPECNNTVPKPEYEATLTTSIEYECPGCGKAGETTAPFKRKTFEGVPAIVFECTSCQKKIPITKKMKEAKKKKGVPEEVADADDDDF